MTLSAALPAALGLLLLLAMVIGGGHPVAQMTGSMRLWSMWVDTWPLLILGNLVGALAMASTFFIFWRPRREPKFFIARLVGLGVGIYAVFMLAPLFPDA